MYASDRAFRSRAPIRRRARLTLSGALTQVCLVTALFGGTLLVRPCTGLVTSLTLAGGHHAGHQAGSVLGDILYVFLTPEEEGLDS